GVQELAGGRGGRLSRSPRGLERHGSEPRRRYGAAPLSRRRLAGAALRAVRAAFGALCRIACRGGIATEALATRKVADIGGALRGARLPGCVDRGLCRGTNCRRDRPAAKAPVLRGKTRSRPAVAAPFP